MPSPTAGQRTTMRLAATHQTRAIALDFDSDTGVEYVRHWARKACGQMPPIAGVMRRALAVYLAHLGTPGIDPLRECRAIAYASEPTRRDRDHQEAIRRRLSAAIASAAMPPWSDVVLDPAQRVAIEAMEARVEMLVALELKRSPGPHRKARALEKAQAPACAHGGPRLFPKEAP